MNVAPIVGLLGAFVLTGGPGKGECGLPGGVLPEFAPGSLVFCHSHFHN